MLSEPSKHALPAELWAKIAEILQPDRAKYAVQINGAVHLLRPLEAMALTNRLLSQIAQPLLFSELKFIFWYIYAREQTRQNAGILDLEDPGVPARVQAYRDRSTERLRRYTLPHIVPHVREITLANWNRSKRYCPLYIRRAGRYCPSRSGRFEALPLRRAGLNERGRARGGAAACARGDADACSVAHAV